MTDPLSPEERRFAELFYPHATFRADEARQHNMRFVHYCTADTAARIITNGEVWLRRVNVMNDFREIEYGFNSLSRIFALDPGVRLRALIKNLFPNNNIDLSQMLLSMHDHISKNTYITCLSEHAPDEDELGRLSMWRAYGGQSGVALVLNGRGFLAPSNSYVAFTSPVLYPEGPELYDQVDLFVHGLEEQEEYLKEAGSDAVMHNLWGVLRAAAICTKHPGFKEEKEWRIVYDPTLDQSGIHRLSIETIRGIPQHVCKLKISDPRSALPAEFQIENLINRVILGPMSHPDVAADAFVQMLADKKVVDPRSIVFKSDIPLRYD